MVRVATYAVLVDWAGNGDFAGSYEDVTIDVDPEAGLTVNGQGRDQARGTAPPQQSILECVLRNDDQIYSSQNPLSPLAGKLLPGRLAQLRAATSTWLLDSPDVLMDDRDVLMEGGATQILFTGQTEEMAEHPTLPDRSVALSARGRMARLEKIRVDTILYENITTGTAMEHLLVAAGLNSSEYAVDGDVITAGRVLAYWYGDGRSALEQAYELWSTEGYSAFFGEDELGVIVFQGRNFRTLNQASQVVQATFRDQLTTGDLFHIGVRIIPGMRDIINRPYVEEVVLRTAQSSAAIWTYSQTITLDGSGAAVVRAVPNFPFKSAVTPAVTTDFTLSAGTVTVALSRSSGGSTDISFSAGTPGATITSLQLRAQEMRAVSTVRAETALDTSSSINKYGTRAQALDAWPGIAVTDAVSLCDAMAIAYQEPRPIVEIDVVNADISHLAQIINRRIGDRLHVVSAQAVADFDVTLETKKQWVTPGPTHWATFSCEKVVESGWGRYDIDVYGTGLFGQ